MDTDELIRRHLPLVDSIARRYRGRGEPFEDLRQAGALGLVLAAKRWDPGRGVTFGAYATPVVTGEIRRHLRDHGRLVRLPRRVWEAAGRCRGAARELATVLGRSPTTAEIAAHVGLDPATVIEAMTASAWPAPLEEVRVEEILGSPTRVDPVPRLDVMGALRPGQRRLLELVAIDRQSQRQIASLYGVSQAQVSRALAAAVSEVRRLIETDATDQELSDNARVLAGCTTQSSTAAPMTRPQTDSAMAS